MNTKTATEANNGEVLYNAKLVYNTTQAISFPCSSWLHHASKFHQADFSLTEASRSKCLYCHLNASHFLSKNSILGTISPLRHSGCCTVVDVKCGHCCMEDKNRELERYTPVQLWHKAGVIGELSVSESYKKLSNTTPLFEPLSLLHLSHLVSYVGLLHFFLALYTHTTGHLYSMMNNGENN